MTSCWLDRKTSQAKLRKALIMSAPLQIGLVLFPRVTQLDFTGPLQVFSSLPGAKVHLIWKRIEPVASDSVMMLTPTITFADCPQLDVICVPGGFGTDDMVNDEEMLEFLRSQATGAKYVTSVCTGSLVLGAAGLLQGYRATTHWSAMENLAPFGATPTCARNATPTTTRMNSPTASMRSWIRGAGSREKELYSNPTRKRCSRNHSTGSPSTR